MGEMTQSLMSVDYVKFSIWKSLVEMIDICNLASHVGDVLELCMFCSLLHDFFREICGDHGSFWHVLREGGCEGPRTCSTVKELESWLFSSHGLKGWDEVGSTVFCCAPGMVGDMSLLVAWAVIVRRLLSVGIILSGHVDVD